MAKKVDDDRQKHVELCDRLIATIPNQKRKGNPSANTSLNEHMFSFAGKNGEFAFAILRRGKKS